MIPAPTLQSPVLLKPAPSFLYPFCRRHSLAAPLLMHFTALASLIAALVSSLNALLTFVGIFSDLLASTHCCNQPVTPRCALPHISRPIRGCYSSSYFFTAPGTPHLLSHLPQQLCVHQNTVTTRRTWSFMLYRRERITSAHLDAYTDVTKGEHITLKSHTQANDVFLNCMSPGHTVLESIFPCFRRIGLQRSEISGIQH